MGQRRSPLGVEDLERVAARSWRGLEEERLGDWLLRAGGGFTGRANSVLVVGDPRTPLAAAVAAVDPLVRRARACGPCAQVPVPGAEAADAAFAAAGWDPDEDVLVLTAPLGPAGSRPPSRSTSRPQPDDAWLAGYRYRGAALPPVARRGAGERRGRRLRLRPAGPGAGAAGRRGPRRRWPTAGWCVTAVTVAEEHRRRGLATAVMAALRRLGRATAARTRCYLQVVAGQRAGAGALRAAGLHRAPPLPLPARPGRRPADRACGRRAPGRRRRPPRARRAAGTPGYRAGHGVPRR